MQKSATTWLVNTERPPRAYAAAFLLFLIYTTFVLVNEVCKMETPMRIVTTHFLTNHDIF